ncbi:Uncharacterised protein [Bordetella pertussis]|nr:Uncharacterised protein [Bordetella pertussis]
MPCSAVITPPLDLVRRGSGCTPAFFSACRTARSTLASSSGARTVPSGPMRSAMPNTMLRLTSGAGRRDSR